MAKAAKQTEQKPPEVEEDDPIAQLLAPLMSEREEIMGRIDTTIAAARAEARELVEAAKVETEKDQEQLKRLTRGLRGFGLIEPVSANSQKAGAPQLERGISISPESLDKIKASLPKLEDPGRFTVKEVTEITGLAEMTIRKGLETLRADDLVRFIGNRPVPGGRPQDRAFQYSVISEEED